MTEEEEKLTKSGICPHCGSDNVVFGGDKKKKKRKLSRMLLL